ncbi:MAG: CPBP family intramembrane glutamic endopeptidase [Tidjanibacter sp.]|nr:CPBP family intramembrane glutamic endopeptidase [Tidjanibacter sp.]
MKKAIRFSIVVCLVSWLSALVFHLVTGYTVNSDQNAKLVFTAFCTAYMFLPLVCGLILQLFDRQKPAATGLLRFRPRRSWLVGWLLVPLVIFVAILCNSLFADVSFSAENMPATLVSAVEAQFGQMSMGIFVLLTLGSGLLAGVTINAVAAFGEEYGWRNYMVDALRGVKFWKAALLIGIVWGLWHFPIILMGHNYPVHRVAGVFMMCLMTLALGVIELYFVLKARSVYPAAIIHGTFNALAGATSMFVSGGNDLLNGMPGLSGAIAMTLFVVLLVIYDRYISREKIFSRTIGESLGRV